MPEEDREIYMGLEQYVYAQVPGSGVLEGIPRNKKAGFAGDKHFEERAVAQLVLEHINFWPCDLHSEPNGEDTPPDVRATLADGRTAVDVEVTKLVDGKIRESRAVLHLAEWNKELTPLQAVEAKERAFSLARKASKAALEKGEDRDAAFWRTLKENHPIPDHWNRSVYRDWSEGALSKKLDSIIQKKDKKLAKAAVSGVDIFLAIYVPEKWITVEMIRNADICQRYKSLKIRRAFVVLDYAGEAQGFPVIELEL